MKGKQNFKFCKLERKLSNFIRGPYCRIRSITACILTERYNKILHYNKSENYFMI